MRTLGLTALVEGGLAIPSRKVLWTPAEADA